MTSHARRIWNRVLQNLFRRLDESHVFYTAIIIESRLQVACGVFVTRLTNVYVDEGIEQQLENAHGDYLYIIELQQTCTQHLLDPICHLLL